MTTTVHLTAFAGLCLLGFGVSESKAAVTLNGTFGFIPIGTVTYTGTSLGEADSVNLPATEMVNTVPANYGGAANDFYTGSAAIPLLSHVTVNPLTLGLPSVWGSFMAASEPNFLLISDGTSPANRFDFSLVELMKTSSGASDLELYGQGVLHDTQGIFADTPGQISIAFTQTSQTSAVNVSFSVATSVVPEAGTLTAGCVAAGLALLEFVNLARKSG